MWQRRWRGTWRWSLTSPPSVALCVRANVRAHQHSRQHAPGGRCAGRHTMAQPHGAKAHTRTRAAGTAGVATTTILALARGATAAATHATVGRPRGARADGGRHIAGGHTCPMSPAAIAMAVHLGLQGGAHGRTG